MRKALIITTLALGGLAVGGVAAADEPTGDQTVVVNQSNTVSAGSSDCAPASVLVWFPWLQVPACS
jgi:hypothetical protein